MDLKRDLFEEMILDSEISSLVSDRSVAIEFYQALCNNDWKPKEYCTTKEEEVIRRLKGEDRYYWSCSWRSAGGYIAAIRNRHHGTNESYMDFYCSGNEGIVTERVEKILYRLGWVFKTWKPEK